MSRLHISSASFVSLSSARLYPHAKLSTGGASSRGRDSVIRAAADKDIQTEVVEKDIGVDSSGLNANVEDAKQNLSFSSVGGGAQRRKRSAESTDWIASAVTRRFGIGAGLAWVGFLSFGVISEQIKTRREVFLEESNTRDVKDSPEVVLSNGIRFRDLRLGGGATPLKGDLVLVSITGRVLETGEVFLDTTAPGKRDIVFAFDIRPYIGGVCDGLEIAMRSMKAGGKRIVNVPPELGFGQDGAIFGDDVIVPGGANLEYVVELKRVSIPPS